MSKVKFSRWLNGKLGGNPQLMISSRCYMEDRVKLTWTINLVFLLIRNERDHCHKCFIYDMQGEER
jgi:hypothetical protein